MLKRTQWLDAARKLDWDFSYVREEDVFPEIASGSRGSRTSIGKAGTSPSARRTSNT